MTWPPFTRWVEALRGGIVLRLHCFICASPLFPDDWSKDQDLHVNYLKKNVESIPQDKVLLTVIQNGCDFDTQKVERIRNPLVKSVAYNWLLCDANCQGDYWLFLPEDCMIKPHGWEQIGKHVDRRKECFTLSKDPKSLIGKKGIFQNISKETQTLCDMNFLGKEIGCVVLRDELEKKGFHCITKNWKEISKTPVRWGNELYETMTFPGLPSSNHALQRPILQDYGFDGWKGNQEELERTFMKIISQSLESQRQHAVDQKGLIAHYGPLICEVPYKGMISEFIDRIKK